MRLPLRSLTTLALSLSVVTCSEGPNAPKKQTPGRGAFALSAVFSKTAAAVYAERATFAAVNFDHVRIVLIRPPSDTVKDTTIVFDQNSPPKTIDLSVEVRSTGEVFTGAMDYTNNGAVVFHGETQVKSYAPDQPAPPTQQIVLNYVGPGATATRVVVSPKTSTLQAPGAVSFAATVFDANNTQVPAPVAWSSSDATVVSVDGASGAARTVGKRGSATITARIPTGLSDNGTVTVTLPPAAIVLVSGAGQTGKVGNALAQPGVVRVTASDGLGVAGVTVNFAAPTGGRVGSSSVVTDANGTASSSLTLGSALGPQSFAVSAAGFSVSIGATATPGDPASISVQSGSGQQDTVKKALKQPFVVKVADEFGNGVAGVAVSWARTAGSGSLSGATSTTNADGLASMGYTLGATPGSESVTASVGGVATPATFTAQALSSGPAAIALVSGSGQTGRVAQPLAPFVVRVTDDQGGPVSGALVSWSATNGTVSPSTSTDADGRSSNTMTPSTPGGASAVASVKTATGSVSVTFSVTVQAGVVARMVFATQPANGTAGAVLAPVRIALQDASGNATTAANPVTIALGANAAGGVLTGTLTRAAVSGIATFDDLVISKAGTGYTLVASSGGTPNITSAAFDIAPGIGGLTIVGGNNQIYPNNFGQTPTQMVVSVKDQANTPLANVPVTFTPAAGTTVNGSAAPVVVNTNASGLAGANSGITATTGTGTVTATIPNGSPATFTSQRVVQGPWSSTCLTNSNNAPYCWGINTNGTVGDGTTTSRNVPTAVIGGVPFASITPAHGAHRCGLTAGGQAYCWGRNTFGQLGDNSTTDRTQPVPVQGGFLFAQIATAVYTTCGLTFGGQVYCWGWSSLGLMTDNDFGTLRLVPTLINNGGRVFTKIVVLEYFGCGLEASGTVSCWGSAPDALHAAPTPIAGFTFTSISAGYGHVCGLTGAGAAYCWGNLLPNLGVIGDGTGLIRTTPTAVVGGLTFVELRAWAYSTCGRTTNNALYCWGQGTGGEIGDGANLNRLSPTLVKGGITWASIIGGGNGHTCAVSALGQPFCWGTNSSGQLGTGNNTSANEPVPVRWVEGTAGQARSIVVNGGNNGSALSGSAVGTGPSVLVRDYANNPVAGTSVTFAVASGGGSVTGATAVTNASGIATVGSWVLGVTPGANTLSATLNAVGQVVFSATGLPTVHLVTVSPPSASIAVGGSVQLSAAVTADAGASQAVTWSSSDPTKATVDATGKVTGVAVGPTAIVATSVVDLTVKGASAITVAAPTVPQVTISSINQTVCNPTCTTLPANLSSAAAQLDFVLGVNGNGLAVQSVTVQLNCPGSPALTAQNVPSGGPTGSFPVTLSLNTAQYDATTGVPAVRNGACTYLASATSAAGTSGGGGPITINNPDGVLVNASFAAITSAEGLTQPTSATDAASMVWRSGAVTVATLPVLYSGRTIATLAITLPGATTPTQTLVSAPYNATWSGTATTGARVTGLTLVDATGCVSPAVPPLCGLLESNGATPRGVTPVVTAVDASGNPISMALLNPNTPQSTFRLDNTPPEAPLAFNIPAPQFGWVNSAYAFATVGGGVGNALVGVSQNYISCGDGAAVTASPYVCRPQIGVSASPNGQIGVGTAVNNGASNGLTTFSFYAIPVAGYVPASADDGTSTTAAACSTAGWAKIVAAGDLAATVQNNAYKVRVFESDKLGNARCIDLAAAPPNAAALGTYINTGVANRFATNQAAFGVDKGVPAEVFIEPASDPTAVGANQTIAIGAPVPSFKVTLIDDASGFSTTPVSVALTRLAIDPSTATPSTVNSAFGCVLTFISGNCLMIPAAAVPTVADGGTGVDGYYTYSSLVSDLARNTSPTIIRRALVDRAAPVAGGITVPASLLGGASISFATTASDNVDLVAADYRLTYPVSPSGNPIASLPLRYASGAIGVAFDNTLTTAASFNHVVPLFIRTIATTAAATPVPQNNAVVPTQIAGRVYDAASNASNLSTAAIPAGNIPLTSPTDYTAPQASGAVFQSFQIATGATNISNCPSVTCAGGGAPVNATSLAVTVAAAGSESGTFAFANPFVQVQLYYFDVITNEWVLASTASAPSVSDNGTQTVRTFTWTFSAFDPPASLGSGVSLKLIAVGVNALGDALATGVNANVTLTNP